MLKGNRIIPSKISTYQEYLIYLRHLAAYNLAKNLIGNKKNICDIGCGDGYGAEFLSNSSSKVIGLDIDRKTIINARAKHVKKNCKFLTYGGKKIPFKDNYFDVCISFQVLEHVENEAQFLEEVKRILVINGQFMLSTPNGQMRLGKNQKPWNRNHLREYSFISLNSLLKNHFKNFRIYGLRASKDIEIVEKNRINLIHRIEALDILKFRKIKFLQETVCFLKNKLSTKSNRSEWNKKSIKDFHLTSKNLNDCLDLFAICTKN
jgi:2-polyprenyl-3-methyl-5-hydroxy-6-metoxy-1,4-benzoquinol methylase